jgi:DNA processing protein
LSQQSQNIDGQKRAALKLSLVNGVGPKTYQQLLENFGGPEQVLRADSAHLKRIPGIGSQLAQQIGNADQQIDVAELIQLCQSKQIRIISRHEESYPNLLKQTATPPNILYTQGELTEADSIAIAIVGSRHATHYGKSQAESLGRALALAGFTVVSGLARGIDAAAHLGALKAGGRTLAVLGSGLLNIYPSEHKKLAAQIAEQGAVISECHPEQPPRSGAFPQRNRIVTGLCLGTIVVEAAQRSGALISARLAMEQDREVFAVPGPVNSRMSQGCHRLIKDGAKLVESIDDVLEELGPLAVPSSRKSEETIRHPAELKLSDQESRILQSIGVEPTQLDEVIVKCGLPVQRVLSTISVLEMRKLVKRVSGTTVARI